LKNMIKRITIILSLISIVLFSIISVSASEVNFIPANYGDTVEYELRVNPCPDKIQALDVVIYYDSSCLEYIPYSLELSNISGYMTNTNIDGEIRFNAMDFDGFNFDEDKVLSKVKFTVKDTSAENINLTYEVKSFLDTSTTDLGGTYFYDITSVNGNTAASSQLGTDSDLNEEITTDSDSVQSEVSTDTQAEITSSQIESEYPTDEMQDDVFEAPEEDDIDTLSANDSMPNSDNNMLYLVSALVGVLIVMILGIVFSAAVKHSKGDKHNS